MTATATRPDGDLTYRQQERIFNDVLLNRPVPEGATPAELDFRRAMVRQISQIIQQGRMPEMPLDPTYGGEESSPDGQKSPASSVEMATDEDDDFAALIALALSLWRRLAPSALRGALEGPGRDPKLFARFRAALRKALAWSRRVGGMTPARLRAALKEFIAEEKASIDALTAQMRAGSLPATKWYGALAVEALALGLAGFVAGLRSPQVRAEYEPIVAEAFARQVEDLDALVDEAGLTEQDGRWVVRSHAPAAGAWSVYEEAARREAETAGHRVERRVLDPDAEHCEDCLEFAGRGWAPIGSLPRIGEDCECGHNCRCHFETSESSDVEMMTDAQGHEHAPPGPGGGRFVAATNAMRLAHPFPEPLDAKINYMSGLSRPDLVVESPEMQDALRKRTEHRHRHNLAFSADLVYRLLRKAPNRPIPVLSEDSPRHIRVGRAKRAFEDLSAAGADVNHFRIFAEKHAMAALAHPEGLAATEAARLEAKRRYEAAKAQAEAHIAALPPEIQAKARRAMEHTLATEDEMATDDDLKAKGRVFLAGLLGVELATYHAPAGYTHAQPMMIGGKPFVGGEFIPSKDYRQATPEQKAQIVKHSGLGAPKVAMPSLVVQGKYTFTQRPDGTWFRADKPDFIVSGEQMHRWKAEGLVADVAQAAPVAARAAAPGKPTSNLDVITEGPAIHEIPPKTESAAATKAPADHVVEEHFEKTMTPEQKAGLRFRFQRGSHQEALESATKSSLKYGGNPYFVFPTTNGYMVTDERPSFPVPKYWSITATGDKVRGELYRVGLNPETVRPANAHLALADALTDRLAHQDGRLTAQELFADADLAYGGTRAEGKYGPSDAYDALEAAVNRNLRGKTDPRAPLNEAVKEAERIADQMALLPTQTNRSGNKDALQQFSTPPHYGFAVNWIANLRPDETVLEPSAGTGSLAVHAANAGAQVYLNELDPRRADFLKADFPATNVHVENAEHIAAILPGRGVPAPSVVVMNPPFSQTAGRMGDKKELLEGANHITEAARMLAPGGRLVAIVGRGMTPDSPTYRAWFDRMKEKYALRANVGVEGREYNKYGTSFGTRVLVFDKTGPHQGETVIGDAEDVPDLMKKLEGVRNDRPQTAERALSEQAGGAAPEGATGAAGRGPDAAGATGALGAGEPTADRPGLGGGVGAGVAPVAGDAGGGAASGRLGATPSGPGSESGAGVAGAVGALGEPAAAVAPKPKRGRKAAGGQRQRQPEPFVSRLRPAQPIAVEPAAAPEIAPEPPEKRPVEESASLYEPYRPARLRVPGSKPHPTSLVESSAMAAVAPPEPTYRPTLSPDTVERGLLTEPALESIVYAGQAHQKTLPEEAVDEETSKRMAALGILNADGSPVRSAAYRRGYFVGDGTGAGKGRQIAGVIADNWNQGRKRHVWVSMKQNLHEDAVRDWRDIGMNPAQLVHFDDIRGAKEPPKEGVAFITYDTLKSKPKDPTQPTNLEHLAHWLGKDFDGVIAFDEAHAMGNAVEQQGQRGAKDASARALAGVNLQKMLPNARVVYVSATGATEIANLAYAERLGIWGHGTPFATKQAFIDEMKKGGVAAMEAVAQSLKATGNYGARSLSFGQDLSEGDPQRVTYERLTHDLTPDQRAQYDAAADAWQSVLQNIDRALEMTGVTERKKDGTVKTVDKGAKAAARSAFWGAQQRFFNQVMTSMQTPTVIRAMEEDLKAGRAPVVQLVNTMEAATKRALARDRDEEAGLEDLDVSPREVLMQLLEKSFPVHKREKYMDENGNTLTRLVEDSQGRPVEDPEAVALRDEMLDKVGTLRIPESPLDMVINHFGHENVAEATGRTQRVVAKEQEDGTRKKILERRSIVSANSAEASAFQAGKKKILIFSDAGGTGRSYHADRNAQNQAQRVHYMLQPGWRADNAVQGLGRTHRTNQAIAPTYRLVEIDQLKAQKRFISTIARRLSQLGALTRGQRQTGSGGLFSAADNLESHEATVALGRLFADMRAERIESLPFDDTMRQLGFKTREEEEGEGGRSRRQEPPAPPISQFLNRLLSLRVDKQAQVFDAFDQRLQQTVEQAVREGTLDVGVENFPADKIERKEEKTVWRDADSGAEVKHFVARVSRKAEKREWVANERGEKPVAFVRNRQSGRVWAVYKWVDKTNEATGDVTQQYALKGPGFTHYKTRFEVDSPNSRYEKIDAADAKEQWQKDYADIPDVKATEEHFLTGAFLPVWDRIPGDKPKIYRLRTPDGRAVVGRHIPAKFVPTMLKNLGVHEESKTYEPAKVHKALASRTATSATLANGWELKSVMVQRERRIELRGVTPYDMAQVIHDGVIKERVGYETRFFVPTGAAGAQVLERIIKSRPVTEVEGEVELAHDVSAEPRDRLGEWTTGGKTEPPEPMPEEQATQDRLQWEAETGGAEPSPAGLPPIDAFRSRLYKRFGVGVDLKLPPGPLQAFLSYGFLLRGLNSGYKPNGWALSEEEKVTYRKRAKTAADMLEEWLYDPAGDPFKG